MSDERDSPYLSVVLPAHNEVGLLSSTVLNIASGLAERSLSFEIIVVENGSSDGTPALARLLLDQVPEMRLIELGPADYGAALFAGFDQANGDLIVSFDVDYYDLAFLDAALAKIAGSDLAIVLASKKAPGASDQRPLIRRTLTTVFSSIVQSLLQLNVKDAHGMKVLDRSQVADLARACVMSGSLFDVELVVRASRAGLGILEMPAHVIERRPPRTSVLARAAEGLLGVVQLNLILRSESSEGPSRQMRVVIDMLGALRIRLGATRPTDSSLRDLERSSEGRSGQQ